MKSFLSSRCAPLLVVAVFAAPSLARDSYPQPQGYLTDAAAILDPSARQSLDQQLLDFERGTGDEIAIATVPSLDGKPIDLYANELFAQWKIGKKGKDNGILILVAPRERKVRIEVGYGLEPVLPDGLCGQIIREKMSPYFKEGRYNEGLHEGVVAIQTILSGGQVFPPSTSRPDNPKQIPGVLLPLAFVGFFVLPFTTIAALIALVLLWALASGLKPLGFLLLPLGFLLDMMRYRSGVAGAGFRRYGGPYGGGFGGGFGGGGFGGFGGGSSGGGGASGGW